MAVSDRDDIAIVGMAGRFPDAPDLDTFWANLRAGRECVHFYSDAELAAIGMDAPALRAKGHVAATPRLADPEWFDAAFFGYTADQAALIDPQQRLFLEVCWEALENAGRNPRGLAARAGIFAGQGIGNYLLSNLSMAGYLNPAQYFSSVVSNGPDFLCSRVAFACDLTGPCVTVQTACSTGLVAVHQACQSLLNFECDIAVAGSVTLQLLPLPGHFYDGGKTNLSADGHSRVFDERATGTVFGDGSAAVVLRRLDDALADGDPVRAIIRGTAINNSGAVAGGFSTPSARAQEDATLDALAMADVSAESIGYVEAHGAANTIGDAIEVTALSRAYRKSTAARGFCGLGAVKSNVGHLGAAAGMASLCKTVLALEHREIPPTILVDRVNPGLGLEDSPFRLVLKTEPFVAPTGGAPRRAGVNSYGIGGSNAHVVLEEAPQPEPRPAAAGPHLLVLSAATRPALAQAAERLATHLERATALGGPLDLADVAYTLATGRPELMCRRAFVCTDVRDAVAQLRQAGEGAQREPASPRVVLVCDPAHAAGEADRVRLITRWVHWKLPCEGVLVWGQSAAVNQVVAAIGVVPESATGAAGLAELQARGHVTLVDALCGPDDALAILGALWVRGSSVAWDVVCGPGRRRVALPSYPFQRGRHWVDLKRGGAGYVSSPSSISREATGAAPPPRTVSAPARSALEMTLCRLWASTTGVDEVGLDDNFLELGGTSLQLAEVHTTLRTTVSADVTVVDVFMNPTVRALAAQIERVKADPSQAGAPVAGVTGLQPGTAGELSQQEMDVLRTDARLAGDVRPAGRAGPSTPTSVLLTGATGFLGVYLLKELLTQTSATIYCHVRAADSVSGHARVQKALEDRDLWDPSDAGRIVPVCGDLGQAGLGVSQEVYAELSQRIDTIVHNGATVNFTPPYASLKPVNVDGTEDVLRFACAGRTKTCHFVSTTGVWGGRFPVAEDDPMDEIAGLENGYTQSKWVAERLVQEAGARGLPITIHRPPRVVGDTRTGSTNLDDFVARAIKGCAQLGSAPAGHFFDIMSPVDFVARAIVTIALAPEAGRPQRFHVTPPSLMSWRTVLDFMPGVGIPLDVVPYPEWRARLIAYCQDHDNALKTLLPLFRPSDEGGFAAISLDYDLSLLPDVPCENATGVLAPAGVRCPPMDAGLLDVYFRYFFQSGFLSRREQGRGPA